MEFSPAGWVLGAGAVAQRVRQLRLEAPAHRIRRRRVGPDYHRDQSIARQLRVREQDRARKAAAWPHLHLESRDPTLRGAKEPRRRPLAELRL